MKAAAETDQKDMPFANLGPEDKIRLLDSCHEVSK